MKANDLVDLAGRNLRESSLRNSLTTLGIGVGVASLVAMLSLGIGLQQLADRRLARSGLFDTIVVTSGRSLRGFGRPANPDATPPAESRPLDEKARTEMARLPNVLDGCSPLGRSDILRASCCMLTRFATLGQFFARDYSNLPVR